MKQEMKQMIYQNQIQNMPLIKIQDNLTTCPVNVGTGLKITNTIHIPSIEKLKQVDDYYKIAHKIGVNFKGVI